MAPLIFLEMVDVCKIVRVQLKLGQQNNFRDATSCPARLEPDPPEMCLIWHDCSRNDMVIGDITSIAYIYITSIAYIYICIHIAYCNLMLKGECFEHLAVVCLKSAANMKQTNTVRKDALQKYSNYSYCSICLHPLRIYIFSG